MLDTFETLSRLTAAHGVSGQEGEIRTLIASLARPYADELWEDVMGNLIVHKRGPGPKVLFSAHMDSVGLMVTALDEEGFARFGVIGGVELPDLIQQRFRLANGAAALCCVREEKRSAAKRGDLYLDLGAENEAEARAIVKPGDTAAFDAPLVRQGKGRVTGCYLDNRIGCLALLQALERVQAPANDLYFLFSVQEEVGTRGAKPAAFHIDPDYGVAVDVTIPDDVPGSDHDGTTALGKGAAIKVMDRSVICAPGFVETLKRLAEGEGIPYQMDIITCGGTDGGPIRTTRGGVVTGGISIPCRYTHSALEQCDLSDLEACVRLITAVCEKELPRV